MTANANAGALGVAWLDVAFLALVVSAILLYFTRLSGLFDRVAFGALQRVPRFQNRSTAEIHSVSAIAAAGASQIVLVAALSIPLWPGVWPAMFADLALSQIAFGVLLGLGQMAVASFLCNVLIRILSLREPGEEEEKVARWLKLQRGGWMRQFLDIHACLPPLFAQALILAYIAAEEILFRVVLVQALIPFKQWAVIAFGTLLFVICQFFGMPSWRHALFPAVGAMVVGLVHTMLILEVASILPLICAHYAFFVISARRPERQRPAPLFPAEAL